MTQNSPPAILLIGMAGSGKTTVMQRLNAYLSQNKKSRYIINLDPAVSHLPYEPHIDIRQTVHYKKVMDEYKLGPNGAILTSLNLFTTKFDQVLSLMDKRSSTLDYILLDTPGQIEIFTWSASGEIITQSLASSYPTVIVYIMDTPRNTSPITFMSNMLYACSILYKTKLPFIILFNKTDVVSHGFAVEWMKDFESFQAALEQDTSYMASMVHSMSLVLEEFYQHLKVVGISAMTGLGMEEFFHAIDEAIEEYDKEYKPQLLASIQEKQQEKERMKQENLAKLMESLSTREENESVDQEEEEEEEPVTDTFTNKFEEESFARFLDKTKL